MNNKAKIILISVIVALVSLNVYLCVKMNKYAVQRKNDIEWYKDSLKVYRDENGVLTAEKKTLEIDNWRLLKDVDSLKDIVKIKPQSYTNVSSVVTMPSDSVVVYIRDTVYQSVNFPFEFSDKWYSLKGNVGVNDNEVFMKVNENKVFLDLETYLKDGKVFVRTDNPYATITSVNGIQYKKERKIRFGCYAGVGLQYGLIERKIDLGPQLGAGVLYVF